jgi:predicted outer membrane repeat protein
MQVQSAFAVDALNISCDSILYVDSSAIAGLNDGSSWADAYTDLQDALLAAQANDKITCLWVAAGTYYPTADTNLDTSFVIRDSLKVYGGFNPANGIDVFNERDWTTYRTILSGDIGGIDNYNDNVYHVVKMKNVSSETRLDGFTIERGNGYEPSNNNDSGAGLFNDGSGNGNRSNPCIANCRFRNNNVSDNGAAIWNNGFEGEASPTITNCLFENNFAGDDGGAIDNNGAGGGVSSPIIDRCVFRGNHTGRYGGAIKNYGATGESSPTIQNCLFSGNAAYSTGGALNNDGTSGGISTPTIVNCTFAGNSASTFGGAIRNFGSGASPRFINTLVWNNTAPSGSSLANGGGASASFFYSLFQGFFPPGPGVLNGFGTTNNPNFINPIDPSQAPTMDGDYRVRIGSPIINKGVNDSLSISDTLDVAGGLRIFSDTVDIGAYEFRYEFPCGSYDTLVVGESPIISAEYKADNLIQSASMVDSLSGGPVIFNSVMSIELLAGFEVKLGEVFEAKTEDPCQE